MHRCCVLGCPTKSGDKIPFHPFPSDEHLHLKEEWINAVGRINWEPALSSRVCSKHFNEEDFYTLKKAKRLSKLAVPSINVGLCDTLKLAKMTSKECVVPTCTSQFSEAPYFHFPKDKSLCLKWLLAIPKGGWSLNQDSQVCSRHFEKTDIVMHDVQAWLKTGSAPKLYLDSPTIPSEEKSEDQLDSGSGQSSTDNAAPGSSKASTSQDVDLVEESQGIYKIKLDADDGSESDLEIIEPEIETYEVSDTSDEEVPPPPKPGPPNKVPLLTSLNLQVNEIRNILPKSNVVMKPASSSNGRVIRGDSRIKCCVPRCSSVAGSPAGVGFHSFPQVGETRLSVRSLDNKLTVHDLFSMWKSLLSVPVITKDSYVCTRHFTANDYNGNVLNKVAVPTQFLPTPVTFAPCKVQDKIPVPPPPLVLLNKSKNPPPILRKPTVKPPFTYSTPPIRFPGIPSINNVSTLTRVTRKSPRKPQQVVGETKAADTSQSRFHIIAPKPPFPLVRPPPPPIPKKPKLGCSITFCANKLHDENNKAVLYRLPHNIEKCKEWVYSCGHPEWLDKGMVVARSVYRICSLHFADEMFVDDGHKILKGSAKPTVAVQEPYKKCIVKHCHNYYDKDRLHYIGVDFAAFPTETNLLNSWVKAVKNNTGISSKSIEVTADDIKNFTGAVICSLHFRNSDYVAGPHGKSLSPKAVPSMNLVYVKEAEVPVPTAEVAKQPDPTEHPAASSGIDDAESGSGSYVQRARRRPYQGRKRWKKMRGRRPGWMKSNLPARAIEGDETNDGEDKEGTVGDKSSSLPVGEEQGKTDDSVTEGQRKDEETLPPTPARRGRPGRKPRGGGRGGRSADTKKRKSHAERQREYVQRHKAENIQEKRKKDALRHRKSREKQDPDKRKLKNAAYSKAYRDRKKMEKFSNVEAEVESRKSQSSTTHRHTQVEHAAGTSGTIQNVPESSQELRRKLPPVQDDGNEEQEREKITSEEQSSVRRSTRIETLYGPTGRPLRSAVLKRKRLVESESGSESQGSDEEPLPRKRGRPKKLSSDNECSDAGIRRSLRPRRAASTKKFVMDDFESEEDFKDDDWIDEYGSNEPINYGGGVAEGGHFLDPVLGVEPFLEESPENVSAQPAVQEPLELDLGVQQKEDVTLPSCIEEIRSEVMEEPTSKTSSTDADEAGEAEIVAKENKTDGVEGTLDGIPVTSHICDTEKESDTNDVEGTLDDIPSHICDTEKESDTNDVEGTLDDIPVPCDVVKVTDTKDVEQEPVTKNETVRNEAELSKNLETDDQSDAPQEVNGEKSTKELVESQVPQPHQADESMQESVESQVSQPHQADESMQESVESQVSQPHQADESMQESEEIVKTPLEDKENVIPFGPKLPIPTKADVEFFRSIIPTMASFSHLQKTELRDTIITTLKEMLNEDLDLEVMSPETGDSVKNECQMPLVETIESV